MILRCINKECSSHEGDQHLFSINITVDEDRELSESLKRVDPQYFACSFCGDSAEFQNE